MSGQSAQGGSHSCALLGWIHPGCLAQISVGIYTAQHLLTPREEKGLQSRGQHLTLYPT